MSLNPPNNPTNNLSNQPPNYCICKEDDPEFIKKKIFLQSLETALLFVGAFIYYDIMKVFQKPLLQLVHGNIYLYHLIRALNHVFFLFLLDFSIISIFAFVLNIPI